MPMLKVYPLTSSEPVILLPPGFVTLQPIDASQLLFASNGVRLPAGEVHAQPTLIASTNILPGQTISGPSVSIILSVKVQTAVLSLPSVAVYSIRYSPTALTLPGDGPLVCSTVTSPQLSTATGMLQLAPPWHIPGKRDTVIVFP